MGNWPVLSLREAGVSLIDCDHRTPLASERGYPYVAIPQIKFGRIDLAGVRHITHDHFIEWTRKANPKPYDVILSRRCNPGETAFVPPGLKFALGQNLVLLRADGTKVFPPFLRWLVRGTEWWEQIRKFLNVGAVFDSLKCADIPNFCLPIPPLSEQRAIASLLGALDDKIELNRQMNETLEAMTRLFFKDWFVDFGPTRAKAEGRPPYLVPKLWELFPATLDDDDKPAGWVVKPLDQVANFLNGLALQKYPAQGNDFLPVIKIAELRSGITAKSDRAATDIPSAYVVEDGDILFSWSGSLTHLIWTGGRGALNQHLFKVTSDKYPKWFFFYWIAEHMPNFQAIASSKATTMGHIQRHHLTEASAIVSTDLVLKAADELISPLFGQILENSLECQTLTQTRDLLLPKLISGEIRLREAKKIIEEAL